MLYVLAIFLPSLTMLLCGKPFQAALCLVLQLTLIGWLPATVWAWIVVNDHRAERRHREMMRAIHRGTSS